MKQLLTILILLLTVSCSPKPALLLYDINHLESVRKEIRKGNTTPAYDELIAISDNILKKKAQSVVEEDIVPPSGDKHDYMSQGPYWWPDPTKPDGLPYIRKDGRRNPEINKLHDSEALHAMSERVFLLSFAYYFSSEEKYAEKAAELLNVWFLDPQTKMNPNLNFGQRIPGICDGRGVGLIDTHVMARMLDGVTLLNGSRSWTSGQNAALKQWFSEFSTWMLTSKNGKDEAKAKNNHGTYYDYQLASFLIFSGRSAEAAELLKKNAYSRFDEIDKDGSQPLELERTKGWSYSQYNLVALMQLASVADNLGMDLWNYINKNGSTFKDAVMWFVPYMKGTKEWDHQEISGHFDTESYVTVLLSCYSRFKDDLYLDIIKTASEFSGKQYLPGRSVYSIIY